MDQAIRTCSLNMHIKIIRSCLSDCESALGAKDCILGELEAWNKTIVLNI